MTVPLTLKFVINIRQTYVSKMIIMLWLQTFPIHVNVGWMIRQSYVTHVNLTTYRLFSVRV